MEELKIVCGGIDDSGKFLRKHTGRGEDISPEFVLSGLSRKAKTLVITLEDMSHPIKRFTHWVVWNIPAGNVVHDCVSRGEYVQGIGYGFHRYAGPKPPRGKTHKYRFTVYVLDCSLDLSESNFKKRVLKAADGHIIQRGEIYGIYE